MLIRHTWHTGHMQAWRALSTAGVAVAIAGCSVAAFAFAAAQPRDEPHNVGALPISSMPWSAEPSPSSATPRPSAYIAGRPRSSAPTIRPAVTTSADRPTSRTAAPPHATTAPPHATTVAPPPSTSAAPRGQSLPLGYSTGSATRVITVVASSTGSTTATLQGWNKAAGGGWLRYGSAVTAHVGSQGLTTQPSESKSATPIGSFTLTLAFGRVSNPGTQLSYFRTDASDWWVSDKYSRYYNTHHRCSSSCPFNTAAGENLRAAGFVYTYAVVINYNRFPVTPGAGSAFFLHVTDGGATAGCVAISQSKLVSLMRWLSPSTHPRILIAVS